MRASSHPLAAPSAASLLAKFQWRFFCMLARAKLSFADRPEEKKKMKTAKEFYHIFIIMVVCRRCERESINI